MARARNIKPGFCTNEDLAECSFEARLCFALLPMLADREGRMEDRPKRIKGELFRFDSLDVEPLLAELQQHGFIARYTADGRDIIQILAFRKHQNPHHREPESSLPPPPSLRLDPDGKYIKPEAQPSSQDDKASDKPEASPGLDPPRVDLARGVNRADSGFLIPDSGTLIPDSGEKRAPELSAGEVCRAMRAVGIADTNPSNPKLIALIAAGLTLGEFIAGAEAALRKQAGMAYALTTAENRRHDAAKVGTLPAAAPPPETAYQRRSRETVAAFAPGLARRPPGQRTEPETIEAEARDVTPPTLG